MKREEGESAVAFSERLYKQNREAGVETLRPKTREALLHLAKTRAAKRILEVGTAEGATAVALLTTCRTATLVTVEADEERYLTARENLKEAGVSDRARTVFGYAEDVLPALTKPFDLILLDGPKGAYAAFYDELKRLLAPQGAIFADDVLFHGYVTGETPYRRKHGAIIRSLKAFLKRAEEDDETIFSLCEEEDGYALLIKR